MREIAYRYTRSSNPGFRPVPSMNPDIEEGLQQTIPMSDWQMQRFIKRLPHHDAFVRRRLFLYWGFWCGHLASAVFAIFIPISGYEILIAILASLSIEVFRRTYYCRMVETYVAAGWRWVEHPWCLWCGYDTFGTRVWTADTSLYCPECGELTPVRPAESGGREVAWHTTVSSLVPILRGMLDTLNELETSALAELDSAGDPAALEAWRISYLGSKGKLKAAMAGLKDVPKEEKPAVGKRSNEVKQALDQAFKTKQSTLGSAKSGGSAAGPAFDLTESGIMPTVGRRHIISRVRNQLVETFGRMGFAVAAGDELEDDEHNFVKLNIPADHPAR
ncbi:MAG: hypothetical protein AAGB34_03520, partial [Planctomycetota bacterium]